MLKLRGSVHALRVPQLGHAISSLMSTVSGSIGFSGVPFLAA